MSGDAPHLHMLNLIAGSIPASLEFYRRPGVTVPADTAGPHVQGVEPDTLFFFPPQPLLGTSTSSASIRPRASSS